MKSNPFIKPSVEIKRRKNPQGEYSHLKTAELLDAVRESANSTYRADLDILLDIFLKRYDQRQQELDNLNRDLEARIKTEVNLGKVNQKRFEQQAKMAAMGEMMDAVAHQWKQPLNALSMMSDMLRYDFESELVDKAYIDEMTNDTQIQIEHMITTLNEFRNFFRPRETKESFGIKRCVQSVMLLVNDEFLINNISIHVDSDKEIIIHGIENEFKHLVLNIINNAKDAFNERDTKQRDIFITFNKEDDFVHVDIQDTAGGIPLNVINDIFKPEVTTKEVGKGTGIGLYMSMQIAQKLGGSLSVKNINSGACFSLQIPL
ncbi:HAMP domain-containing histidine kinase [Candidatus Sulfurimonas marisnigri]|uniref:histidine kinase n=1 Tax=Candidatus Sulfurimonas marisnigri TaxID=2740405 RepID=A0A7S7RQF7_9BACT|nr:HAMP domain-containing sensor histidine kinase [Candidatus Sulfurimonas marisnigri]QOY54420.1 HAMP domain-containing histidine kinase [Candidatus Sulfurimonas marisnigri]